MAAAVRGLSPVIITVRIPSRRSCWNRSAIPVFTTSLSTTVPITWRPSATSRGGAPSAAVRETVFVTSTGTKPLHLPPRGYCVRRSLADSATGDVDSAHPAVGAEGHQGGAGQLPTPEPEPFFGQHDDGATLRCLVCAAGQLGHLGQFSLADIWCRFELSGLTVAEGDGACFVEEERGAVSGGLHRPSAHGKDVGLDESVHAGDADGGQQGADGGGDQRHQ